MKKALALILALLMLCSTVVFTSTAADPITIDMLDVYESVGYKAAYAGAPINNGPTLDGVISEGEYQYSRTIAKEDMYNGSSSEIQSGVTEYFAHNENFVYYAAKFTQASNNRAFQFQFKVTNTFDVYHDATVANDYYYLKVSNQLRIKDSNTIADLYNSAPSWSNNPSSVTYALPSFRNEMVANASKDANNVKVYEIRLEKAYFANILGIELEDLRVIPYCTHFHSDMATADAIDANDIAAIENAIAEFDTTNPFVPAAGETAWSYIVLDDEVNEVDGWETLQNDLGWNIYVGDALTSNQKLDGKIGESEYTFARELKNDGKFLSSAMESSVIEYLAHDADFLYYAVQYKETLDYRTCNIRFRYSNSFEYQYAGSHLYQNGVGGTWFSDDIEVYPRLNGSGVLYDVNVWTDKDPDGDGAQTPDGIITPGLDTVSVANGCTGVGGDSPSLAYIQKDGSWTLQDAATPAPYGADLVMAATLDTETRIKTYEYRFDKAYFTRFNSRTSNLHIIGSPSMVDFKNFTSQIYFHGNWSGLFVTDAYKAAIKAAGGDDAIASKYAGPLPLFYVLDEAPEGYYQTGENLLAPVPQTSDRASARISYTNPGLRFKTTINTNNLERLVSQYGAKNVQVGTLIAPTDMVNGTLTHKSGVAGTNYIDVVADIYNPFTTDGNNSIYAGSISNIKAANLTRSFTAVGYIAYFDGTEWNYIYSASVCQRDITTVVNAALADTEAGYTQSQIDVLNAILTPAN